MSQTLIKNILKSLIPQVLWRPYKKWQNKNHFKKWQQNGATLPLPHILKQITISEYQVDYKYDLFIETGTYMGAMVEAQKANFKKIISIELSDDLYIKAQKKFMFDSNISIIRGDSGKKLIDIMHEVKEPVIFWLDGHFSDGITAKGEKDCPIFEELTAILKNNYYKHIILIDDARLFIGKGGYPTIEELRQFTQQKNNKYTIEIKHDIIRCTF